LFTVHCKYQLAIKQTKHKIVANQTLPHATVCISIFKEITQNISTLSALTTKPPRAPGS